MPVIARIALLTFLLGGSLSEALAQPAPAPPRLDPRIIEGAREIRGALGGTIDNLGDLQLTIDGIVIDDVGIRTDGQNFVLVLRVPVTAGQKLQVRIGRRRSNEVTVTPAFGSRSLARYEERNDPFDASAYLTMVLDNFASEEFRKVNNTSGATAAEPAAGVNVEFRLFGDKIDDRQLRIFSETLYTVRSAEVECTDTTKKPPPVCEPYLSPANIGQRFFYVLEHARSFEAFVGLAADMLTLQRGSTTPVKLYVHGQLGLMAVADSGQDSIDNHGFGLGLRIPDGKFDGTYFQVGVGKTDLYVRNWPRYKFDGILRMAMMPTLLESLNPFRNGGIKMFIQLYADTDFGHGSDSIQTYIGFDFDVGRIFK